jgi:hypothetical protein
MVRAFDNYGDDGAGMLFPTTIPQDSPSCYHSSMRHPAIAWNGIKELLESVMLHIG